MSLKEHQVSPADLIEVPPEEDALLGESAPGFAWALQGRVVRAYEGFLEMPVVVVAMWLAGVTLVGLVGVASLYLFLVSLRMLITGV